MKLKLLPLAITAALGTLAASQAQAILASNYTNTTEKDGTTQNYRISGASAQDSGILNMALSICKTTGSGPTLKSTMTWYSISNNNVYFCQPDSGTGAGQINIPAQTPAKTQMAIYKYSVGGSGNGVQPVNDAATLPFLDLAKLKNAGGACGAAVEQAANGSLPKYDKITCSSSSFDMLSNVTTRVGVSDLEPDFFSGATGNLTATPLSALIFGVPVTKNVRDRMQHIQGLGAACIGLDTEACMPSLSSAQLVSLYTSAGQQWANLGLPMTTTLSPTGLSAAQITAVAPLSSDAVFVARRVDSSGTQKTFEALVAHTPNGEPVLKNCITDVDVFVTPDDGNTTTGNTLACDGTATVFAGSGGGDVRSCLNSHNSGSRGAIGILTTEDKAGSNGWRFVKADGNAPTQAQTAAGKYRFYTESSLNVRSDLPVGYGESGALVDRMKKDFANKAIIALINGSDQPFGPAGLMALLSLQSAAPDNVANFTGSNSINPWTKLVGGTTINNCQAPKLLF